MQDTPSFISDPQFEPAVRGARSALDFLALNPRLDPDDAARLVAATVLVAFASEPGQINPPPSPPKRLLRWRPFRR